MPCGIEYSARYIPSESDFLWAGQRPEGVALRALTPPARTLPISRGLAVINNSSPLKWERLAHKQLDGQFVSDICRGLNCSPFEAGAILDAVYRVYAPCFQTSGSVRPGQLLLPVVAAEVPPGTPLDQAALTTVCLTLDAGCEDLDVRRRGGIPALRRHRLQRLAVEAFQQGGLLTLEDLAYRLLNCGLRTLCRDVQILRREGIALPLRSTIKDIGRSLSHRVLIVQHWLAGKQYAQIARATHHSLASVASYIDKFKRVIALAHENYDVNSIAFLIKLSAPLVTAYFQLERDCDTVPHRREELDSFLKKNSRPAQRRELVP